MTIPEFDPQQLALPHIRSLQAYVPGVQPVGGGWIKLNTNELPYPCSPRVAPAVAAEIGKLPLYPHPTSIALRQAIADYHNVKADQVIVGNGSDDVINLLVRAYSSPERGVAVTVPSYSLYQTLIAIQNGKLQEVELPPSLELPVDALVATGAPLLFLTSPNAPTGVAFSKDSVESLLKRFSGIVVLDEAYVDFAQWSGVELLASYPNLMVTRTFSKSYGLAGLRVGYALGDARLVELLDRLRDSYNVDRLAQAGALAALLDRSYHAEVIAKVKATRTVFLRSLALRGWHTYPSQTNFVFTRPETSDGQFGLNIAGSLFEHLYNSRILIRKFPNHPLTAPYLRISIGTDAQMDALNEIIDQWQQNA
ncbi:MAG: histidinol-phosphate transaminase [Verrucomicrobia bacterium]|nr:histidinol-phosphate transaminase [Verrucomicrobiota bacterium]